jgi:hypothetical protein
MQISTSVGVLARLWRSQGKYSSRCPYGGLLGKRRRFYSRNCSYVHKIASENEDTLEFVSSAGDRIIVALTDEERR